MEKIYNTKMKLLITLLAVLFLSTLVATSAADYIIPVDIHSSNWMTINVKNQELSRKILFASMVILSTGVFFFQKRFRK